MKEVQPPSFSLILCEKFVIRLIAIECFYFKSFKNSINLCKRKELEMSYYDDGYSKGYEDAENGDDSMHNFLNGLGSAVMDTVIPEGDGEAEWSDGYRDGWEAGNAG